jgi:hypothetical protein
MFWGIVKITSKTVENLHLELLDTKPQPLSNAVGAYFQGAVPMRRFAHILMIVGTALLIPGCYGYNAETADLAFMDVTPEIVPGDVTEVTDTVAEVVADAIDDVIADVGGDAAECTCSCEPQPCTCTCIPGGTCEFNVDDFPATGRLAGDPCTADTQCFTDGVCVTTELAGSFWPGATIPDGVCTRLYCADDSFCADGGVCLDTVMIDETVPRLCGKPCETDVDCRCGVDYVCLDSLVSDGEGGTVKACLPLALANLLKCGEAVCPEEDL